jgi:hypothetical protein
MVVQTKVVGRRGSLASWEIHQPFDGSLLRDLIETLVHLEVQFFRERQEERKLIRVLTPDQIGRAAESGRIHLGGDDLAQSVDPTQAVEAALTAFRDGLYFVFIDDVQIESLDAPVHITPGTQLLFLRLTPLVGG